MSPLDWRVEVARARRPRRFAETSAAAPMPPPGLPPGTVVEVPGRGEILVRDSDAGGAGGAALAARRAVLLLHGWTATADMNWFRAYDAVAATGRVLALDHRGHGRGIRSTARFTLEDAADDAAALLDHLGTGPAVVVGYSMGGPVALHMWRRHPHVVAGLVLEATALEWRATRRERAIWKLMGLLEVMMRAGRARGLVERTLRDAVEASPDLAPYVPWLKGELRRGQPDALADAGRALGDYDARAFARFVDVPTAVVVTTRDRLCRPRKQRALAAAIPGAQTFELDGDHDASLVLGRSFAAVTEAAVRSVLTRLEAPSSRS